jgi:hypothetical protein
MDLLQEHLIRARATAGVFARSAANPPWGLRLSGIQLAVHAVVKGQIWLWTGKGEPPVTLRPGDIAFVPADYAPMARWLTGTIMSGNGSTPASDVEEVTGRRPTSFKAFAERQAAEQDTEARA